MTPPAVSHGEVAVLVEVLEGARRLGFLGPEPVDRHVEHAHRLATRVAAPARMLDLGSGAGVPGLVLALDWPDAIVVLLDSSARRTTFCREAVSRLGIADRVSVVRERAEDAGRLPALRERFDLVVARSFSPPSVTAECAAPFLSLGGHLLVSEPPNGAPGRWPDDRLAVLGLGKATIARDGDVSSALIEKVDPTPERFPRRSGVPAKRPLWT